MSEFRSKSVRFSGAITLAGPLDAVFPLFSPLGEKLWVPGWNPELLHPSGALWEEGLVFRTSEERGDAVWIVSRLDLKTRKVEYWRVEPERYVARIKVSCAALGERVTEASTSYEFIGLSENGNSDIAEMTPEAYAEKMTRWGRWINEYLRARED